MGVTVSIPLVIGGAALIMALLERFPVLVWAGAALLGWIGGGLVGDDPAIRQFLPALPSLTFALDSVIFRTIGRHGPDVVVNPVEVAIALAGAAGVVATVSWCLRSRRMAATQS
jgi:hypothetical protein